jgi:hypothetical protein
MTLNAEVNVIIFIENIVLISLLNSNMALWTRKTALFAVDFLDKIYNFNALKWIKILRI